MSSEESDTGTDGRKIMYGKLLFIKSTENLRELDYFTLPKFT